MHDLSEPAATPAASKRYHLVVLLLAVGVRLGWASLVPVVPVSDSSIYDLFARNLTAGYGYAWGPGQPTMYWAVGPAFLFSVLYRVFGLGYGSIVVLNLIMGVGSVALVMGLARRWFGSPSDLLAGLILGFWPSQIEFTTVLASETPFLFLMLAGWFTFETDRIPWPLRAALTGLFIAAASFMRPTGLLLAPIFALGPIVALRQRIFERDWRRLGRELGGIVAQLAVIGIVMAACITPWALRNKHYFGKPVLISANGGINTWMGNSPGSNGMFRDMPVEVLKLNELEREEYLGAQAKAFIVQHPGQFITRSLVKLLRLHERESIGVVWNQPGLERILGPSAILVLKIGNNIFWWAALALAIGGALMLLKSRGLIGALFQPAVLIWGYFASVHAATVAQDRYHFPIIPSLAILGGYLLATWLARRVRSPAAG